METSPYAPKSPPVPYVLVDGADFVLGSRQQRKPKSFTTKDKPHFPKEADDFMTSRHKVNWNLFKRSCVCLPY